MTRYRSCVKQKQTMTNQIATINQTFKGTYSNQKIFVVWCHRDVMCLRRALPDSFVGGARSLRSTRLANFSKTFKTFNFIAEFCNFPCHQSGPPLGQKRASNFFLLFFPQRYCFNIEDWWLVNWCSNHVWNPIFRPPGIFSMDPFQYPPPH